MKDKIIEHINETNKNTVFHALGISIERLDPDETIIRMPVDNRHLQHIGLVHGGIYVLLAESAASMAGACALKEAGVVVGLEINANHLSSVSSGVLFAKSKSIHQGRSTMVYEIKVTNEENKLISIARCTLMVKAFSKMPSA